MNYHILLTLNGDLSGSDQVCLVPDQNEGEAAGDPALPEFVQGDLGVLQTGTVSETEHHHDALVLPSRVRVLGQVRAQNCFQASQCFNVTVSHCHSVTTVLHVTSHLPFLPIAVL